MRPIPQRPPRSQSNLAAALFILTLPLLAYSSASAQGAHPATGHQVGFMLGLSAQFNTDLGLVGTSDDVQPVSLIYGYNFTARHGILVQLTSSTDLEEGFGFAGAYASTSVLYKATFPDQNKRGKAQALCIGRPFAPRLAYRVSG